MNRTIIFDKLMVLIILLTLTSFSLLAAPIDQLEGRVGRTLKGFRALTDGKAAYLIEPKRQLSKLNGALKTIKAYDKLIEGKDKDRAKKLESKVKEEIKVVTAYIEKKDNKVKKDKQDRFDNRRAQKEINQIAQLEKNLAKILKRMAQLYKSRPKGQYMNLESLLKKINELKVMEKNRERYKQLKNKTIKEMKFLSDYMNGKEYKKVEKKRAQKNRDSWRLGKTKMKARKYFAIIQKWFPKGKVLRVVIESPVWNVTREYNIIKHKSVYVKLALKYKKKCYYITGELKRIHQGGGRYGRVHFKAFRGNTEIEMNCKNVYK